MRCVTTRVAFSREDGKVKESTLTVKPAPSDLRTEPVDTGKYAAKVIGPYETVANVIQKKLPLLAALGSMRIKWDMSS